MSKRPGIYLGAEDVRTLHIYLCAYTTARDDLGVPEYGAGEEAILADFQHWLEEKLGMRDTRGWHALIEREDSSTRNILTFIRLFNEFLRSRGEEPIG